MDSFLDLLNVIDSDGVSATRYRLYFVGNVLSNLSSTIFGFLTELVYVVFQAMVIPGNALLGLVLNSSSWLGALGEFYQKITAPLYAVFPPWALASFGLALVAVAALRPKQTIKTRSAMMGLSSGALDRIGGAVAMAAMVLVLTYNPFAMISKVLELANGFSLGLAAAVTGSSESNITPGPALIDASLRTPTIALNYGTEMTAACRTQWSQAMAEKVALAQSSGCFTEGSNSANPGTLLTAIIMLILPALPMLAFCGIAAWKYLTHLTFSVLWFLATGWVAAISVHKQRGFERLTTCFGKALSHLLMAIITSMLALALPATVAGVGMQLLGLVSGAGPQAQAYVMMVSLGIGFGVSAWAINKVVSIHGALARVLHNDFEINFAAVMSVGEETKFSSGNLKNYLKGDEPGKTPWESKQEAKKKKSSDKASALAADPVSSTAGSRPNSGPVPDSNSEADDAVEQLMEGAQTGADGGQNPTDAGTAGAAEYAEAGSTPETGPGAGGILFGFPTGGVTVVTAVAVATEVNVILDPYGYWSSALPFTIFSDDSDIDDPGAALSPRPPGGPSGSPGGGSALAALPRSVIPDAGGAPGAVPGLMGSDPALEAVALDTGAIFVAGEKPALMRPDSPLLRTFTQNPISQATPGGVPDPAYAPPLAAAGDPATAATEAMLPTPVWQSPEANAQRQWNQQRGVRDSTPRGGAEPPTPTDMGIELATGTDIRTDPSSFQADMPDFEATNNRLAQINEIKNVSGAGGEPAQVLIDPNDPLLGLEFSSDPEERVRPRGGSGFGDPQ